jgi:hypothetical protein
MGLKITPVQMAASWMIEQEAAGVPALVGVPVRIEIQTINPMLRRPVISPLTGSASDERYAGLFGRIKPQVVRIDDDVLTCGLGIVARKITT